MPHSPHDTQSVDPARQLAEIKARIHTAALEAGKDAGSIQITAVSKMHNSETIEAALKAGHRVFGENRIQEALKKWPPLLDAYSGVQLRLIGPLQTNKVREAVSLFDVIETLDRPKLAKTLAVEFDHQGKRLPLLVQVNTGAELQKAGILPEEVDTFIDQCRKEFGLEIEGLMCIPPVTQAPAAHFGLLAKIAKRNGLSTLSMGMSGDFEIAAQLGATHVRVGSQIFGARPT